MTPHTVEGAVWHDIIHSCVSHFNDAIMLFVGWCSIRAAQCNIIALTSSFHILSVVAPPDVTIALVMSCRVDSLCKPRVTFS